MKRYKILGNSFKQYIALSSNTFTEGKENIISERNIDELINSFKNRKVEANIYKGHKAQQSLEREAIGKILNVYKSKDGIGLEADLELTEEGKRLIETASFYPSIEMCGKKQEENDDSIKWSNCELKALAFVEYPASKSVDLLCASGIIEENKNYKKGDTIMNKLKELLEKLKTSDTDSRKEFIDLFTSDSELQTAIINYLIATLNTQKEEEPKKEEEKTEENETIDDLEGDDEGVDKIITEKVEENDDGSTKTTTTEEEDEDKKKKEVTLSAITFEQWTNEYAESKGGIRCSSKSVSNAFNKAKKLYKGGFNKKEIIGMVKSSLIPLGNQNGIEENIDLSAIKENEKYSAISEMFK